MARKKRFPHLSAEQAHSALRWLHATGKIKAADISAALKRRDQLVAEIRKRLAQLDVGTLKVLRFPLPSAASARKTRKRVSVAARKAWKVQGQYLGSVRSLSKADRSRVRAVREKNGVHAAITAARQLAGKRMKVRR